MINQLSTNAPQRGKMLSAQGVALGNYASRIIALKGHKHLKSGFCPLYKSLMLGITQASLVLLSLNHDFQAALVEAFWTKKRMMAE